MSLIFAAYGMSLLLIIMGDAYLAFPLACIILYTPYTFAKERLENKHG